MKVALVTWEGLPILSEDDRLLAHALDRLGVASTPALWTDPAVDWSGFDVIVVRSTWDYYRRAPEFLSWIERVGAGGRLWNPPSVIRWNSHKSYLLKLEAAGIPIVPTRLSRNLDGAIAAAGASGWPDVVLKPAVSAGGYRTFRVNVSSVDPTAAWRVELAEAGEILAQPYQQEVERTGERSLVFFNGKYSHGFLRRPRLTSASPLQEGAHVVPTPEQIALAGRVLAAAPGPTLYARVDLVEGNDGGPRLMELELIEPALGLATSRTAAKELAAKIRALGRRVGSGRNARAPSRPRRTKPS
ncbi:MAG TPA: hypothetical protein VLX64_02000 [Thermoplasmata archaeon]|nr:hypothetical protein [Thermoplasmata archaeon]